MECILQKSVNPHRFKLVLVMAMFALPVVASYLAYFVWQPQGATRNYGTLIHPEPLPDALTVSALDGLSVSLKALRGKWLLVQTDTAACTADCEKKLYAMRQVRLMQGREQDRILRVWLITDAQAPRASLQKKYEGMQLITDPQHALIKNLTAEGAVTQYIYMIDPLGNVMMRWPGNPDIKRMFKDIERLLKASQIG